MTGFLIALTTLLPLVLALGYVRSGPRAHLLVTLPWAALPGLLLALFGGSEALAMPWLLEGAVWGIDDMRRVFLAFTSLLWLVAGLFALFYFRPAGQAHNFALFWLLTLSGNLGLILAQDIASFYSFFALMTFAAYGLVAHERTPEALRAGRVYMAMALAGEMALLGGLIMAAAPAQLTLLAEVPAAVAVSAYRDWIMVLLFSGFGVKAGVPLLHFWLPLAHPAAPTPASAVLSGAMIKAGLFGWLYTLPLGEIALPGWAGFIASAGLLAALGGALLGVCQRVPKAVLAYSSISQMGLMTMMLGVGLAAPAAWNLIMAAIVLYAMHHGLAKGALFLSAGAAEHAAGWPRWLFWVLVCLPGLSLTGIVFSSGAAGKGAFKEALHQARLIPGVEYWLEHLLSIGAVATTLLVARYLWCLWAQGTRTAQGDHRQGLLLSWLLATFCSLVVFWWLPRPERLGNLSAGLSKPLDFLWPLALGLLLAVLVRGLGMRAPALPPGDLIVPLEQLWQRSRKGLMASAAIIAAVQAGVVQFSRESCAAVFRRAERLLHGEQGIRARSGLIFAALLLLLLGVLLLPLLGQWLSGTTF